MLPTLVRRAAASSKATFDIYSNPYRAKRQWPPDFTKLTAKHQFRLERRYRRRAKLKWARPRWTKGVKFAQWGGCLCKKGPGTQIACANKQIVVLIYGVFIMDWADDKTPFKGVRLMG